MGIICSKCHHPSHELNHTTKDNTPYLSFNGETHEAKIVYIYDGDTIHIVFKYKNQFYRWNCRINGVDTPELRTKNQKEKKKGYEVRDLVSTYFQDRIVRVKCFDFDKYGRLLIDVYMPKDVPNKTNCEMFSQWLIDNGHAYAYNGGTKHVWDL